MTWVIRGGGESRPAASSSLPVLDRPLELFLRNIAALEQDLSVKLHGRELRQLHPLQKAEAALLHDLDIKGIGLAQLRDRGADLASSPARRIIEIEPYQHAFPLGIRPGPSYAIFRFLSKPTTFRTDGRKRNGILKYIDKNKIKCENCG